MYNNATSGAGQQIGQFSTLSQEKGIVPPMMHPNAGMVKARGDTMAPAIVQELDAIISRLMTLSDRQEHVCSQLFGPRMQGEGKSENPIIPGIIGQVADRTNTLRRIIDSIEQNTIAFERLA